MVILEEVLRNNTAKLINEEIGSSGTCVIYQLNNIWYALTAGHCIFGKKFEHIDKITPNKIKLKYGLDIKNKPEYIEVLEILLNQKEPDIALLKIVAPKTINNNYFFNFYDYENPKFKELNEIVHIWGYPTAFNSSEKPNHFQSKQFVPANLNQIEIELNDDSIKNYHPESNSKGYSGSGMFIENNGIVYLLGILNGYKSEEEDNYAAFYRAIGIKLSSFKNLLKEYISFINIKNTNKDLQLNKLIEIKDIYIEKRNYFKKEEAILSDIDSKFSLLKKIEEVEIKIREIETEINKLGK